MPSLKWCHLQWLRSRRVDFSEKHFHKKTMMRCSLLFKPELQKKVRFPNNRVTSMPPEKRNYTSTSLYAASVRKPEKEEHVYLEAFWIHGIYRRFPTGVDAPEKSKNR